MDVIRGSMMTRPALQEDLSHTQEDFETHVLPLVCEHPTLFKSEFFTLENFRMAASWVASRAFGVDSHHGGSKLLLTHA